MVLLMLSALVHGFAQPVHLRGIVVDGHTLEGVPYASITLIQQGVNTVSDSSGHFHFMLPSNFMNDSLLVSYIGYETYGITITRHDLDTAIIIGLARGGNMREVMIKASVNKGLYLWKKIMAKKPYNDRYQLDNFGYEAYNKLEIEIKHFNLNRVKKNILLKPFSFITEPLSQLTTEEGSLPAYLVETLSDYAYQRDPKKYAEHIRASNTRGFINESMGRLLGVMKQNVNIYSNYINVFDRNFISPFNDRADNYYRFSVPDTQTISDKKIFHFVFRPKNPGQNTFEGDAWVIGGSFQILRISLYLSKNANINYISRVSIFQEFAPVNDSMHFLARDKFFADFQVLGKKSLVLTGRKTTSYRNIRINSHSIRDALNDQKIEERITSSPNYIGQPDSAWAKLRHDSLSQHEAAVYATIDQLLVDPKYTRLQDNFKFLGSGYKNIGNYEIGKWYSLVSGNQWEGMRFRLDAGTNKGFHKNIHLHSYLAYGTRDEEFKGQVEAYCILQRKPNWLRLHASYMDDVDNGISHYGEAGADNVFSLAVRKPNSTRKFLRVKDLRFEIYKEWGKGFSSELFISQQKYTPLQNLPSKINFPVSNGEPLNNFEIALKMRFAYLETFITGDFFRYAVRSKYPIVEFTFAKAFTGVNSSAYNYTKIAASIKDEIKISPLGSLEYQVFAGKINGTLPFTFLENHAGNDLYYYYKDAFNLMYRFEYISDRYAGFRLEHQTGPGIFRFTALTRKLKWRQFWNFKAMWGSLSNENRSLNNATSFFRTLDNNPYMEAGTGIDNIFRIFRLDMVWRIAAPHSTENVSRFGVFGSLRFHF